jgi:PIN domain nuclease of toxin-antitoxin system
LSEVVLDASALLAMLRGEPGGEKVAAMLDQSAITTVNLGEVIRFYARRGIPEAEIRNLVGPLPIARHDFDEALAYAVGLLLPATMPAGLSFGDRACLALAQRLGRRVLTGDRAWLRIADAIEVEIELIR